MVEPRCAEAGVSEHESVGVGAGYLIVSGTDFLDRIGDQQELFAGGSGVEFLADAVQCAFRIVCASGGVADGSGGYRVGIQCALECQYQDRLFAIVLY